LNRRLGARGRLLAGQIDENLQLFDFAREPGDTETIDALDQGETGRTGPNPDAFAPTPA